MARHTNRFPNVMVVSLKAVVSETIRFAILKDTCDSGNLETLISY